MTRTCILCRYWEFNAGEPDWSDVTPGDSWSSGCSKDHWYLEGHRVTTEQYRHALKSAGSCPDFTRQLEAEDYKKMLSPQLPGVGEEDE